MAFCTTNRLTISGLDVEMSKILKKSIMMEEVQGFVHSVSQLNASDFREIVLTIGESID